MKYPVRAAHNRLCNLPICPLQSSGYTRQPGLQSNTPCSYREYNRWIRYHTLLPECEHPGSLAVTFFIASACPVFGKPLRCGDLFCGRHIVSSFQISNGLMKFAFIIAYFQRAWQEGKRCGHANYNPTTVCPYPTPNPQTLYNIREGITSFMRVGLQAINETFIESDQTGHPTRMSMHIL